MKAKYNGIRNIYISFDENGKESMVNIYVDVPKKEILVARKIVVDIAKKIEKYNEKYFKE